MENKQWMCVEWRDGEKSIVDLDALVADPDSPAPRYGWDIIVKKDGVNTPAKFLTKTTDYVLCQYIVGELPSVIPNSPQREENETPSGSRTTDTELECDAPAHVSKKKDSKRRRVNKKQKQFNTESQQQQKKPNPPIAPQTPQGESAPRPRIVTGQVDRNLISHLFQNIFDMYRFVEQM